MNLIRHWRKQVYSFLDPHGPFLFVHLQQNVEHIVSVVGKHNKHKCIETEKHRNTHILVFMWFDCIYLQKPLLLWKLIEKKTAISHIIKHKHTIHKLLPSVIPKLHSYSQRMAETLTNGPYTQVRMCVRWSVHVIKFCKTERATNRV